MTSKKILVTFEIELELLPDEDLEEFTDLEEITVEEIKADPDDGYTPEDYADLIARTIRLSDVQERMFAGTDSYFYFSRAKVVSAIPA